MPKKIIALHDYVSASDAAHYLSEKFHRPISVQYISRLAKRKKNPVRTHEVSNRLLYSREDIENCIIRKKDTSAE